MPNKKFQVLPLIIGAAAVALCCCIAAGVVVMGGLLASPSTDSAISVQVTATSTPEALTPTPEEQTPVVESLPAAAIVLTSQQETTAPADGVPVKDSQDVALIVPTGSLTGADGVVMTAALPPDTLAADLTKYGLERKSLMYTLKVAGTGENVGGVSLSFPAASPDDRLAVLLERRFVAVLGVTPQDGRLVVTAVVSPGQIPAEAQVEGGGTAYFVVAGGGGPQGLRPPASLTAGFANLRPVTWVAGSGAFSPLREAVCYMSREQPILPGCLLGFHFENTDRSIIYSGENTPEVRADWFSQQFLIEKATAISDAYLKSTGDGGLGITHLPTPSDPLLIELDNSSSDPYYSPFTKRIYLSLAMVSQMGVTENQQTLAHEMFHWIEHKTYSMVTRGNNTEFYWQMETRAEAATFLINSQYQTAELVRKGAAYNGGRLGWQEAAFDWTTAMLGLKVSVDPARYVHGLTVRMGLCTSDGDLCRGTAEAFAADVNAGTLSLFASALDNPTHSGELNGALDNTARYLLGFEPKVSYAPGVDFGAPALQTGRGIGDFIHASNYAKEYVPIATGSGQSNLTKSVETGVVQIHAPIGPMALYPLRLSNGADKPLDDSIYTGDRVQPNVPYSLRIEAGVPFYYTTDSGELIQRTGSEATVIEPITSVDTITIWDKDRNAQELPGIPVVRLVAINYGTDSQTLQGTFAPMPPQFTANPEPLKIPDLKTPVKLEITGVRIFPNFKSFIMVFDYHDGSLPTPVEATVKLDGTGAGIVDVTDTHTFRKNDMAAVTVSFRATTGGGGLGWPDLVVPVKGGGAANRPAFNYVGLQIAFGNTNYNPSYAYEMKKITWTGLSFATTEAPSIQGTVSADYKTITVNLVANDHNIQLTDIPLSDANEIYKTYSYRLSGAGAILAHALEDGGTPNWTPEVDYPTPPFVNIYLVQNPR